MASPSDKDGKANTTLPPGMDAPTPTTPSPAHDASATPPPPRPNGHPFATKLRRLSTTFSESDLPEGFLVATGSIASSVASMSGQRRGSFAKQLSSIPGAFPGTPAETPLERDENAPVSTMSPTTPTSPGVGPATTPATTTQNGTATPTTPGAFKEDTEEKRSAEHDDRPTADHKSREPSTNSGAALNLSRSDTQPFENGYHFPPSHGFVGATKLGALALWKFFLTPLGFCVVIYFLLVVAWGGMIFLLLCNAAPAMCHPDCDDIESPRRKWIEYCSQILNGLFCVTGFGLAPWRFRDLYLLMQYRLRKDVKALRRLAGIHKRWYRLPGSQDLPIHLGPDNIEAEYDEASMASRVPFPLKSISRPPLTGERAPPTKGWKMDFMIWSNVWNTIWQTLLAAFMWGMNRYERPPWSTGLWVGLALGCAIAAGLTEFLEGKKVKSVEGVELSDADKEKLARDKELNIPHYNNYKDKKPKPEEEKEK